MGLFDGATDHYPYNLANMSSNTNMRYVPGAVRQHTNYQQPRVDSDSTTYTPGSGQDLPVPMDTNAYSRLYPSGNMSNYLWQRSGSGQQYPAYHSRYDIPTVTPAGQELKVAFDPLPINRERVQPPANDAPRRKSQYDDYPSNLHLIDTSLGQPREMSTSHHFASQTPHPSSSHPWQPLQTGTRLVSAQGALDGGAVNTNT